MVTDLMCQKRDRLYNLSFTVRIGTVNVRPFSCVMDQAKSGCYGTDRAGSELYGTTRVARDVYGIEQGIGMWAVKFDDYLSHSCRTICTRAPAAQHREPHGT